MRCRHVSMLPLLRAHRFAQFHVPLLINDRLDIALAVKAAGVHIGQDDMPCTLARQLLGPDAIIGVSVNTAEEAAKAIADGADYVGIGPCYETISKADAKGTLGPRGVARVLDTLGDPSRPSIKSVTIGSSDLRLSHCRGADRAQAASTRPTSDVFCTARSRSPVYLSTGSPSSQASSRRRTSPLPLDSSPRSSPPSAPAASRL
jgi:hypothetical protein